MLQIHMIFKIEATLLFMIAVVLKNMSSNATLHTSSAYKNQKLTTDLEWTAVQWDAWGAGGSWLRVLKGCDIGCGTHLVMMKTLV